MCFCNHCEFHQHHHDSHSECDTNGCDKYDKYICDKRDKSNLYSKAINGGTAPSYQWRKNGNNIGTNTNTYLDSTLVTGDIVSCVLTSNTTCKTTPTATSNSITMTVTTSIKQVVEDDKFKLFPVPATDMFVIQINDIARNDFNVVLYDLTGKMIETKILAQGSTIVYFDTQKLYAGEYVVRISSGVNMWIKKVVVVK
jgi:Secretion system C-terminal sorting domain